MSLYPFFIISVIKYINAGIKIISGITVPAGLGKTNANIAAIARKITITIIAIAAPIASPS